VVLDGLGLRKSAAATSRLDSPCATRSATRVSCEASGSASSGHRQRLLEASDVTIVSGLPVTTIERTIADLVEARTDLSLVADVLGDALASGRVDVARLEDFLAPLAARQGFGKGDGAALLNHLLDLSETLLPAWLLRFATS